MMFDRMAVAAVVVLGSATAVLAGGDDGRGRDGLWYVPGVAYQQPVAPGRKAKVFNSYGRDVSDVQVTPTQDEMRWMKRASSSGRY